ncbi:MAG TPA: SCO family protein [Stenotrophomonas sp.]|nr:SCO family protein [Stenotrophomonas sp.]
MKRSWSLLLVPLSLAAAGLVPTLSASAANAAPAAAPGDDIGGPFQLVDGNNRHVTDKTFHGKPVLLYFGFTSCPDVCPTDLARIERIARRVQKAGAPAPVPVFVSIDPERDTPARMKAYVGAFGSDFVGLTGTPAQVARIADLYHVYYKKVPYGQHGQYTMDHSTFLFLLDRNGRYVDHFGRGTDEAAVARSIVAELGATPAKAKPTASTRKP